MEPTSSGQARRRRPRRNNIQDVRESGSDVPVGTAASARSVQALRGFIEASAFHTLVRQRPLTPLCRGLSPYCGENSEPDRYSTKSLTSTPRVREQSGPGAEVDTGLPPLCLGKPTTRSCHWPRWLSEPHVFVPLIAIHGSEVIHERLLPEPSVERGIDPRLVPGPPAIVDAHRASGARLGRWKVRLDVVRY